MKTLKSIFIALVLFTISSNAQITKGNWMVGGTASYNNTTFESTSSNGNTTNGKGSNIIVSPTVGYFLANNFASGLSGNFSLSMPENGKNTTGYGIGPFARYYLLKTEKTVNVLTQVAYYYGADSNDNKSNELNFKAGPVVYFNSSVGLEFTFNYAISKFSNQTSDSTIRNFSIGFGFQIHLDKK